MRFWSLLIAICFSLSGCWLEPYQDGEIRVTVLPPLPTKPKQVPQVQNTKPQLVLKKSTTQSPSPANTALFPNNLTGDLSPIIIPPQKTRSSSIESLVIVPPRKTHASSIDNEQTQIVDGQKNSQKPQEKNSDALKVENLEDTQSASSESSLQQKSAQIANIIVARQYNSTATEAPATKTKSRKAKKKKSSPHVINFPQTEGEATSQTKARRMTLRELTENLVTYATYHRNPRGNTLYDRSQKRFLLRNAKQNSNLKSCAEMGTKTAAQLAFLKAGGPIIDPHNLDPDGDGYACGWDPEKLRFDDIQ